MSTKMLIDARHPEETRVAVVKGNRIEDFDFEAAAKRQLKGNIYLAKVTRVEPSLQAAFVEYGGNRQGFLPFSEIHPDYYQIPVEDREALLKEEAADHAEEDEAVEPAGEDGEEEREGGDAPETVGGDDVEEQAMRRRRMNLRRRYKIQEVIKRRQILLIQVVKEERGGKGAALTTYLSLAGRYSVLMPNTTHGGGISRKISSQADRKQLKAIMADMKLPKGMGCIIRTAGLKRSRSEIKRDFEYLTRLWDDIRDMTLKSVAPCLIYEDSNLIKRAIRDIYSREIDEILIEGEAGYRAAKDFMRLLMPSHARKVQLYREAVPLYFKYPVESQLDTMYQPIVQLKSGGYIVINPTEALVSIDINSGRSTREHNIEETAVKTNLEAADEIARQLRLRDMAGLVVIDFIDMEEGRHIRNVEKRLKEALKPDRARIQVGRISNFGLMEMSRQRLRTGVLEASTHVCPTCNGSGTVRTTESSALHAFRGLEEEAARGKFSILVLKVPTEVAIYLLNRKRAEIGELERIFGVSVEVLPSADVAGAEYAIEKSGEPPVAIERPIPLPEPEDDNDPELVDDEDEADEPVIGDDDDDDEERADERRQKAVQAGADGEEQSERTRKRRRRRRRGRRGGDDGVDAGGEGPGEDAGDDVGVDAGAETGDDAALPTPAGEADRPVDAAESVMADGDDSEGARKRRRGRRGGRGRAAKPAADVVADAAPAMEEPAEPSPEPAVEAEPVVLADAPSNEAGPEDDASAVASDEPPAKPAPKKRVRKPKAVAPVIADTQDEAPVTAAEPVVNAPPANDTVIDPAASEPAAEASTQPRRKGWWQRTLGS